MIQIVNKYKHTPTPNDVYIGRGSPLGNPFSWHPNVDSKFRVTDRTEAINKYVEYANWAKMNDPAFRAVLDRLIEMTLRHEPVNLVCFCAPKICHGNVLKEIIETEIKNYK